MADTRRLGLPLKMDVKELPTGRHPYRLALFRFAQDAFSLFDMALLAAALHGFRVRFWVVVVRAGVAAAAALAFLRFAQYAFIRLPTAARCAAVIGRRFGVDVS